MKVVGAGLGSEPWREEVAEEGAGLGKRGKGRTRSRGPSGGTAPAPGPGLGGLGTIPQRPWGRGLTGSKRRKMTGGGGEEGPSA